MRRRKVMRNNWKELRWWWSYLKVHFTRLEPFEPSREKENLVPTFNRKKRVPFTFKTHLTLKPDHLISFLNAIK